MDRYFVRTAAVVVCAAWAAGCGSVKDDKPIAPVAAANPSTPAAANDLPATLDGEIARAHTLRLQGSYDEAAKALGQLMLVAPDDVRVVGEYGKVLTQQGHPDEALPFLERAIALSGNDWTLYSALGVAYDQVDEHAKARTAYEHALLLKPGESEVLNNYAVSRMLSGDLGSAQQLLTQASAPGTADAKISNNLALLATMKQAGADATRPQAPAGQPAAHNATASQSSTSATSAPKALAGVVMEKVPADPKAGSVASRRSQSAKLAATHQPKAPGLRHQDATPAAKQQPVLRTAADGQ